MFNYIEYNSAFPVQDQCSECAKAVWEYLLEDHITTNPSVDFGSLLKEIKNLIRKENSRILIE